MRKRLVAVALTMILMISICTPVSMASTSKTIKMTTYSDVLKDGNTVYCNTFLGISKVDLTNGKVSLFVKNPDYDYLGFDGMKIHKGYLYYFRNGTAIASTLLYRINLKSKKKQVLASAGSKTFYGIDGYAIKKNKLYITGWKDKGNKEITVKRVAKLNGKSKKKTSIKVKNYWKTEKKTNAAGYELLYNLEDYDEDEGYGTVSWYLLTPEGDEYYLGEGETEYYADYLDDYIDD